MKTDAELKRDVEHELRWEPSVDEAHIGVTAKDGVVTLTGHVPAFAEKWAAEKAVKRVQGVRALAEELEIKLPKTGKRTDEEIAAACLTALKNNWEVPDDKLRAVVERGCVTLEGEVAWQFQRDAAISAVRSLTGVTGVRNSILLKPQASPEDVKVKIEAALKRSAEVDAKRIQVTANGGKVVLSGSVRSWSERDEAGRAAWAATGVNAIENNITVSA